MATRLEHLPALASALKNPLLHRKVRRQQGVLRIVEPKRDDAPATAQSATPQTAVAACWLLRPGQAYVFELGVSEDIARLRWQLHFAARGSNAKFVTRAHGRLLVVLRIH